MGAWKDNSMNSKHKLIHCGECKNMMLQTLTKEKLTITV